MDLRKEHKKDRELLLEQQQQLDQLHTLIHEKIDVIQQTFALILKTVGVDASGLEIKAPSATPTAPSTSTDTVDLTGSTAQTPAQSMSNGSHHVQQQTTHAPARESSSVQQTHPPAPVPPPTEPVNRPAGKRPQIMPDHAMTDSTNFTSDEDENEEGYDDEEGDIEGDGDYPMKDPPSTGGSETTIAPLNNVPPPTSAPPPEKHSQPAQSSIVEVSAPISTSELVTEEVSVVEHVTPSAAPPPVSDS